MMFRKATLAFFITLALTLLPGKIDLFEANQAHAYDPTDFVITVKTDNFGTSADDQFTLSIFEGDYKDYRYNIDCDNDGIYESIDLTSEYTCDYIAPGTYTISISGNFPRIYFNNQGDRQKLMTVEQWGNQTWSSMAYAFRGASNLTIPATDAPDLSAVTDMSFMFTNASAFNQDISHWDVSNVTRMTSMFRSADVFNQDLSNWDVSNVTNMAYMFSDAYDFNKDISNWNVSNVRDMSYMFNAATSFNQDISNWNVSNVRDMSRMFRWTPFNQDIGGWNVSYVRDMNSMFRSADLFDQDITLWDVSNVQDMSYMFENADLFDQDLGNWDVSSVTGMTNMFFGSTLSTSNYDSLLSGWNDQMVQSNVTFHGGNSTYCNSASDRDGLNMDHLWSISDGGVDCS